jgi:hypothetical protein
VNRVVFIVSSSPFKGRGEKPAPANEKYATEKNSCPQGPTRLRHSGLHNVAQGRNNRHAPQGNPEDAGNGMFAAPVITKRNRNGPANKPAMDEYVIISNDKEDL